ncbi:MAG: M23 family metallopeptidase [Candidatus Pacearchaeota archaeon]|jgi:murein DD-endopeptidase MepM/ murein hydrolase activator NlpD
MEGLIDKSKIERIKLERVLEIKTGFNLPIKNPVKIMQGFNGPWSHFSFAYKFNGVDFIHDDSYSIDFETPFGTPVHATKSGRVLGFVKSNRFYDGLDFEKGARIGPSFIIFNHGDCYSLVSHLGEFEPTIKRGYNVKQGEKVALSGKTGWIGPKPHIHFEVFDTETTNPLLMNLIKYEANENAQLRYPRISQPFFFEDYKESLEHEDIEMKRAESLWRRARGEKEI